MIVAAPRGDSVPWWVDGKSYRPAIVLGVTLKRGGGLFGYKGKWAAN